MVQVWSIIFCTLMPWMVADADSVQPAEPRQKEVEKTGNAIAATVPSTETSAAVPLILEVDHTGVIRMVHRVPSTDTSIKEFEIKLGKGEALTLVPETLEVRADSAPNQTFQWNYHLVNQGGESSLFISANGFDPKSGITIRYQHPGVTVAHLYSVVLNASKLSADLKWLGKFVNGTVSEWKQVSVQILHKDGSCQKEFKISALPGSTVNVLIDKADEVQPSQPELTIADTSAQMKWTLPLKSVWPASFDQPGTVTVSLSRSCGGIQSATLIQTIEAGAFGGLLKLSIGPIDQTRFKAKAQLTTRNVTLSDGQLTDSSVVVVSVGGSMRDKPLLIGFATEKPQVLETNIQSLTFTTKVSSEPLQISVGQGDISTLKARLQQMEKFIGIGSGSGRSVNVAPDVIRLYGQLKVVVAARERALQRMQIIDERFLSGVGSAGDRDQKARLEEEFLGDLDLYNHWALK